MEYISMAINIVCIVFLVLGFLTGFRRGLKRTLTRSIWIVLIIAILIFFSMNITSLILNIEINYTYQGVACANLSDFLVTVFYNTFAIEGANYTGLAEIAIFLISILLNGIIFLLLFHIAKLITLPFYWVTNSIIFANEKRQKREAKKRKEKFKIKKHRFAGALVGAVLGLVSFLMTFTPVIGYVNLAKIVEKETSDSEGRGVLTQNIGDTYTQIMDAYDSSVPMTVLNTTGVDKIIYGIFDGLTSSKINDRKVVLSEEAVYFSKIYNEVIKMNVPDLNTVTQAELNTTLTNCEQLIETVFNSQFISATSDVVIPFGVQYARQNIDTTGFKPYVLQFYNTLFDEMEGLDSSKTKHEFINILGFVKTLNDNNLLLPIIQTPDTLNATYLQNHLTKEVADIIVDKLFAIDTVNSMAPALVNFLLGFGAEQLNYEYSTDSAVTSAVLKQSAKNIVESVIDLLGNYSEESSTKVDVNEVTINALGAILDEVKNILSEENFAHVVDSVEPKLESIALEALSGQPDFMINAVKEVVGNISEVTSFKTELNQAYAALKVVETEFNGSKVDENYDVQYMDFIKIGGALDDIQSSVLFKNNLLLRTMDGAITYYAAELEKSLSTESKTIELNVADKIVANIQGLEANDGIEWQSELPKYKNTLGIFLNLFQTKDSILDKLKSDSDSTLEELGKELDGDLNSSALFNGTDRLLVSDLLDIVETMLNTDGNEALTTLLSDARNNVEDDGIDITWEDEFFHIKQLIKVEFSDTSDSSLIAIGEAIDKVVFEYNNGTKNIPKSNIFTQDIINNFISDYMDTVFEGVTEENDFYSTITSIKTAFNTETISSYKTEVEALLKLKEVKTLVEAPGFSFNSGIPRGGIELGRKIDESIAKGGVIVDKSLVNNFITLKLDDYFTSYTDMTSELTQIKEGFNDSVEKYEVEFTALLRLMDVADVVNEDGFEFKNKANASNLGSSIDTALGVVTINETGYSSNIVNRSLVNGYIKRYISDNISLDADSQFGNVLTSITGTKTGNEFGTGRIDTMLNTYAREFGFLAQLLIITDEFTDITLSTINDVNTNLNTTIAEQFDGNDGSNGHVVVSDPLINSYLVGDSLLTVIDEVLEAYTLDTDNSKYSEILEEVNYNYSLENNGVRDNICWIGNPTAPLYYTNLIDAFVEIDEVLNSSLTSDISQPSDLTSTIASEYDNIIYTLQGDGENMFGNILLQRNGVNKLTKFVMNKIKTLLSSQQALFEEEIAYINTYIEFLDAYMPYDAEHKVYTKYCYLPYNLETNYYAYIYSVEHNVWIMETENNHSGIQVNKPFTHLSELING